jgi:hypothetical protein
MGPSVSFRPGTEQRVRRRGPDAGPRHLRTRSPGSRDLLRHPTHGSPARRHRGPATAGVRQRHIAGFSARAGSSPNCSRQLKVWTPTATNSPRCRRASRRSAPPRTPRSPSTDDRRRKFYAVQFHPEVARTPPRGDDALYRQLPTSASCGCPAGLDAPRPPSSAPGCRQPCAGESEGPASSCGLSGRVDSSGRRRPHPRGHRPTGSPASSVDQRPACAPARREQAVRGTDPRPHSIVKLVRAVDASDALPPPPRRRRHRTPSSKRKTTAPHVRRGVRAKTPQQRRSAPTSSPKARSTRTSSRPSPSHGGPARPLIKSHHNVGGLPDA